MKFPIDVVYIDRSFTVIKIDADMVPSRVGAYVSQSVYILELPAGRVAETNTAIGDKLLFEALES